MFEKEAEEYRKAKSECKAKITKVIEAWSAREETIHDVSFKDGAEFGYNKGKEDVKYDLMMKLKDEGMAEEWLDERYLKDMGIRKPCKEAYLAGLKAGRPKWHKVADGDLPKEHKIYLVAIKDNGLAIAYFNGLHWVTKYNLGDFGHCVETVIAWCEIPTFTEE